VEPRITIKKSGIDYTQHTRGSEVAASPRRTTQIWKINGTELKEKKYFGCPLQMYTASTGIRKAEIIEIPNGHSCNIVVLQLALGFNSKKFHCLRILWISTAVRVRS
jgi:hypothetical protein